MSVYYIILVVGIVVGVVVAVVVVGVGGLLGVRGLHLVRALLAPAKNTNTFLVPTTYMVEIKK